MSEANGGARDTRPKGRDRAAELGSGKPGREATRPDSSSRPAHALTIFGTIGITTGSIVVGNGYIDDSIIGTGTTISPAVIQIGVGGCVDSTSSSRWATR